MALATYAFDGGPFGTDVDAVGLYVAALIAVIVALAVATASVVTTVLTLRAPGMSLRRAPLFSWSMLVGGTVWLLTLPVLAGPAAPTSTSATATASSAARAGLYNRIAWLFWQPTLYVLAVPALGIVADVVPVFARRRHRQPQAAMVLIGLASAPSASGPGPSWAPPSTAATPAPWLHEGPWIIVSYLAVVRRRSACSSCGPPRSAPVGSGSAPR